MNIMIIPEDFRKDQYILKPLFERMFAYLGKNNAKIKVCMHPLMGGVAEATKIERLQSVVAMYPMTDIFILCVDRDGNTFRKDKLVLIEKHFSGHKHLFLAENAWEELETWVLAGLDLPKTWSWAEVRAEVSVKEVYFEKIAEVLKVADGPGGGRRHLGILAAKKIDKIKQMCSEDFDNIYNRLKLVLDT